MVFQQITEANEREWVDVIEVDLWQLMEEIDSDPHAVDRLFEQARRGRPRQMQREL